MNEEVSEPVEKKKENHHPPRGMTARAKSTTVRQHHTSGSREKLDRGGWNWFMPSPSAMDRMMREAGLDEIKTLWHDKNERVYGFGRKVSQRGICKAGLSVQKIR